MSSRQAPSLASGPLETHLRLLSLDGGGVRGLSSLLILQHLMYSINPENPPKPCEYFDLIGGTSTGGLIAIMLGRLEMDIQSCIDAYLRLSEEIFQRKRKKVNVIGRLANAWNVGEKFDSDKLKSSFQDILHQVQEDRHAKLRKELHPKCRVFVCATRADTGIHTVLFRSYAHREVQEVEPTIWEAARATSAAPGFFDPIKIGIFEEEFRDGGTGCNNPVEKVLEEARSLWDDADGKVKCIVSIGTGQPSIKPFGKNAPKIIKTMVSMSTETQLTADKFAKRVGVGRRVSGWGGSSFILYYRFNVSKGLEDVESDDHAEKGKIAAATKVYLEGSEVSNEVSECGHALRFSTPDDTHPIPDGERDHNKQEHERLELETISTFRGMTSSEVSNHLQVISHHTAGTLEWLYCHSHVVKVLDPHFTGVLHIFGKPGAGKSVIFKSLVDYVKKLPGIDSLNENSWNNTFYFAFSATQHERHNPSSLLASLICQQLDTIGKVPLQLLDETISRMNRFKFNQIEQMRPLWTFEDLKLIFKNLITSRYPDLLWNTRLLFVIDAMDECTSNDERNELLEMIESSILDSSPNPIAWIFTSRQYASIDFFDITPLRLNLDQIDEVNDDIKTYITISIARLIKRRPPFRTFESQIFQHLERRANKMFLLVKLLVDLIDRSTDSSPKGIQSTLESLPSTVSTIYEKIWSSIDQEEETHARLLLSWILCTNRPLSIPEFNAALATYKYHQIEQETSTKTPGDPLEHSQENLASDDIWAVVSTEKSPEQFKSIDFAGDIHRLLGPLIQLYHENESDEELNRDISFVTICHLTVKEHFMKKPRFIEEISVHLQLAQICARCIDGCRMEQYDTVSLASSEEKLESMNRDEDLLSFEYAMDRYNVDFRDYAIKNRLTHCVASHSQTRVSLRRQKLWFERYGLHFGKKEIRESPWVHTWIESSKLGTTSDMLQMSFLHFQGIKSDLDPMTKFRSLCTMLNVSDDDANIALRKADEIEESFWELSEEFYHSDSGSEQ